MRILLVGDYSEAAESLREGLRRHRYAVDVVRSGQEAEAVLTETDYDAVVVREGEGPRIDGVKVTRRLRNADVGQPLLVVAQEEDEQTVVETFDAGADQVMDADRTFAELISRVRALLRQCETRPGDTLRFRDVEMDLGRLTVKRGETTLELLGKPYALLELFLRNPETLLSRERIGRSVWDQHFDPFSNVIDVTVSKVRQQLDKPFETPYLHTVVGSGYMLSQLPPGHAGRA
ncbi:MAG: response regulator transcription factor [Planctomycetota bacterium]